MSQFASGLGRMFGSDGGGGASTRRDLDPQVNFGKVGSGFKNMRGFDARRKMMSMTGSARPVTTNRGGAQNARGKGALGQSKAIRKVQFAQRGTADPDSQRSTQDAAWTGTTETGKSVGGTGLNPGGKTGGPGGSSSGNDGSSSGSGSSGSGSSGSGSSGSSSGSSGSGGDPTPSPSPTPTDVSPWADLAGTILKLVMISTLLAIAGAAIIAASGWTGIGYAIGMAMCAAAAVAAVIAFTMATQLISKHGQLALGLLYMAGAGLALAGAIAAMLGNAAAPLTTMAVWLAIAGGVLALMGLIIR